jgi:hypothetical protein
MVIARFIDIIVIVDHHCLIMNMPDESYFPETGRSHYIRYLRFHYTLHT